MKDWMGDGDISFPHLGIYLKNVPKSFSVFGFEIAYYGVIIGIGIMCAFAIMNWQAKKQGMNPDDFFDAGLYMVIFGVLGARLYYVIFSWDYYKNNLKSILNIREGGLAIYGGVIAGFITLYLYCKIKKRSLVKMADVAFLGVLAGQIIGRWGNFMNREVFGTYSNGPLAMRLPVAAVRERDINDELAAHIGDTNYIQVHPTFLYESLYNLALLILILCFQKKKRFDGEVILWYIGGYGIGRCIIEGIRTDRLLIGNTNIAVSQMLGLMMFVVAVILDIVIGIRVAKKAAATSENVIEEKSK